MPLMSCPACARQISTEADSCPQCGHPNRAKAPGPTCYACPAPATTRCQRCGALSCAEHLRPFKKVHISELGGHALMVTGESNELWCERCHTAATEEGERAAKLLVPVLVAFFIVALLVCLVGTGYMVVSEDYPLFVRIFAGLVFVVLLPIFLFIVLAVAAWYIRRTSSPPKLNALLRHHNVDPSLGPPLSDRVKQIADDPVRKIEAIKVYREETGAGLWEGKEAVEAYSHDK